ncbi:transporter substrate-binding domain-containing protein [Paucibacter sp. R3-3]|uniref:Transporter substrate-binding domain-containing protein n=1 Tax=Roseateles agri TaxID=3098619 RepID=A0ABU5DKL1_9BURK|nr:transporter substrate-binding domain-containing protein [Paucibacter sp. R3-3]MDY0746822.1 transporter substrate-binding domain-containing protein [Paucibacter sp. R3-3]
MLALLLRLLAALPIALCLTAEAAPPRPLRLVTRQFPPYSFASADGQPAGPMVELLLTACAEAGQDCQVSLMPWRRAVGAAEAGEVDGIFPVADSLERRAGFELSPDVVRGRYVLFARAGQNPCPGRDVAGRTIATFGPSQASRTLREVAAAMPSARIEIEPDQHVVVRKLLAGRYGPHGLALLNDVAARHQLPEANRKDLQAVELIKEFDYVYGFVPGRIPPGFSARFAAAINEMCRSGRTAATFKPYGLTVSDCEPASIPRLPSHRQEASR